MYIVELILKLLTHKKERQTYNPLEEYENQDNEDYESCEHVFMPVDSTGETLSCTICGLLVKKSDMRYKNFFMNKNNPKDE